MSLNNKTIIIFILILCLGTFLRFNNLDFEWKDKEWADEDYTFNSANSNSLNEVMSYTKQWENTPPPYFVFMYYWTNIFGTSTASLRFPSAIFGVASIILLFFITRELFNNKIALISSFLLSVSLPDIMFSQTARVFSLFTMITLISVFFFIKAKEDKYIFLWFLSLILLNTVHYIGLIVTLIQGIILLKYKKNLLYLWSFSLLFFILLIPRFITAFQRFYNVIPNTLVNKFHVVSSMSNAVGIILFLMSPIMFIITSFIIVKYWETITEKYKKINVNYLFVGIIIFYVCSTIIMMKITYPIFFLRYPLFITPFLCILFGSLIGEKL